MLREHITLGQKKLSTHFCLILICETGVVCHTDEEYIWFYPLPDPFNTTFFMLKFAILLIFDFVNLCQHPILKDIKSAS